jgi:hypothetical protein
LISLLGINFLPTKTLERYMHPIAGATIIISGIGIHFFNL